jgi:hypothetical protein
MTAIVSRCPYVTLAHKRLSLAREIGTSDPRRVAFLVEEALELLKTAGEYERIQQLRVLAG